MSCKGEKSREVGKICATKAAEIGFQTTSAQIYTEQCQMPEREPDEMDRKYFSLPASICCHFIRHKCFLKALIF